MGCPIHIWIPLIAAASPSIRFVRDRFRNSLTKNPTYIHPDNKMADIQRWSPIEEKKVEDKIK